MVSYANLKNEDETVEGFTNDTRRWVAIKWEKIVLGFDKKMENIGGSGLLMTKRIFKNPINYAILN